MSAHKGHKYNSHLHNVGTGRENKSCQLKTSDDTHVALCTRHKIRPL